MDDPTTMPALPTLTPDLAAMDDAALFIQIEAEAARVLPTDAPASAAQAVLLARHGVRIDASQVSHWLAQKLIHFTLVGSVPPITTEIPTDPTAVYYDLEFCVPANCTDADVSHMSGYASAERSTFALGSPGMVILHGVLSSGAGIGWVRDKAHGEHGWRLASVTRSAHQGVARDKAS